MAQRITRLQYINYDRRTDVIELYGKILTHPGVIAMTLAEPGWDGATGYEVEAEVLGWAPYTHRVKLLAGGDALAVLQEESYT